MVGLKHNERFAWITIMFMIEGRVAQSVTIYDAIVWLVDDERIDVSVFGKHLATALLMIDSVESVTRKVTTNTSQSYANIMVELTKNL